VIEPLSDIRRKQGLNSLAENAQDVFVVGWHDIKPRFISAHFLQCARYGIYTFITTTEKPRELQIAEAIRPLAEQGDLNSAHIRHLLMMDEDEANYRPATQGRRRRRR